jgi:hypothetical protein
MPNEEIRQEKIQDFTSKERPALLAKWATLSDAEKFALRSKVIEEQPEMENYLLPFGRDTEETLRQKKYDFLNGNFDQFPGGLEKWLIKHFGL